MLVRITDRPQCLLGIVNHPEINEIVRELGEVYDGRTINRREVYLGIPTSDFAFGWSGPLQRRLLNVVYPEKGMNIAASFEAIFRGHKAVKELLEEGSGYLSNLVSNELTAIISLS